jgi:hypothetical protein
MAVPIGTRATALNRVRIDALLSGFPDWPVSREGAISSPALASHSRTQEEALDLRSDSKYADVLTLSDTVSLLF